MIHNLRQLTKLGWILVKLYKNIKIIPIDYKTKNMENNNNENGRCECDICSVARSNPNIVQKSASRILKDVINVIPSAMQIVTHRLWA